MPLRGLNIIDFHVHLQDCQTQHNLCPEDRNNAFFRHAAPILERVANISEPVHDSFLRVVAMNYKDPFSRFIYGSFGAMGLMETLRLFKNRGLEQLLDSMNRLNIRHSVIHSIEPLTSTLNIIEMTERYRDRFSIFASVAREETDPTGYLTKLIETGCVSGFKIHPIVGGFACGEFYHRTKDIVALAQEARLPVLIHTGHIPTHALKGMNGCSEVDAIEPVISAFPKVKFILAHIGWESWRKILEFGKRYPNVMVETSWQPAKVIRRAVDTLGPQRVLFGSDFPLSIQGLALEQCRRALTDREYVQVVSANAQAILKLENRVASKAC